MTFEIKFYTDFHIIFFCHGIEWDRPNTNMIEGKVQNLLN